MFIYKKTSSDTKQLFGISSIQPYPKQLDTICEGLPLGQWTVSQSLSFTVGSTPSPRLFRKGSFRVITPGRRQTHCDLNDPIPESYYKPVLLVQALGNESLSVTFSSGCAPYSHSLISTTWRQVTPHFCSLRHPIASIYRKSQWHVTNHFVLSIISGVTNLFVSWIPLMQNILEVPLRF